MANVRPGMTGTGRTVFEGSRIEEFRVEVLGVLENALGPKHSVILARLEGGPLAKTGVIAGMSGSPVFIDGQARGRRGLQLSLREGAHRGHHPHRRHDRGHQPPTAPRAASTRFRPRFASALAFPLDRDSLIAALRRPAATRCGGPRPGPWALSAGALSPLALPLVFSGLRPR